jgi:predicted ribosome quality control (RQC) complex YloA/Tae2 family protein
VANGELIIVDTDEGIKIKIGDNVSHFNDLEYVDKPITDALSQKADKSELNSVNAAQLNGKTATEIENTLKKYADEAANIVKNDLLNGAEDAYDTLKDLGDLINENTTALDALKLTASGKADLIHSHEISDINELSTSLNEITEELGKKVDSTEILPIV